MVHNVHIVQLSSDVPILTLENFKPQLPLTDLLGVPYIHLPTFRSCVSCSVKRTLFGAMSKVQINNVVVLNNPAAFGSAFQFQITFDCMENLEDDLEWKLTYVGSAESSAHDQILDTIYVGPVPEGRHMFVFQVNLSGA